MSKEDKVNNYLKDIPISLPCDTIETLMQGYMQRTLKISTRDKVLGHLINCARCRKKYIAEAKNTYHKAFNLDEELKLLLCEALVTGERTVNIIASLEPKRLNELLECYKDKWAIIARNKDFITSVIAISNKQIYNDITSKSTISDLEQEFLHYLIQENSRIIDECERAFQTIGSTLGVDKYVG